eukprot:CAMPEP_0170634696 /NCGR_PEP_ID=MMETSP0224-20130122/36760_1 /TAXON_ID=285029 /ORGANISM="Togula jolla, Strain CCCM 725" /LENGTH=183 /DNA_ID=CAMNT_0010964015 /DNA_START=345 /DNA_END=893 /DNA_ORIENTATION=+
MIRDGQVEVIHAQAVVQPAEQAGDCHIQGPNGTSLPKEAPVPLPQGHSIVVAPAMSDEDQHDQDIAGMTIDGPTVRLISGKVRTGMSQRAADVLQGVAKLKEHLDGIAASWQSQLLGFGISESSKRHSARLAIRSAWSSSIVVRELQWELTPAELRVAVLAVDSVVAELFQWSPCRLILFIAR